MAKETKIGLAAIGLLLLVFSGLLVRRLQTTGAPATSPLQVAGQPAQSPPGGTTERASIVVAQKNAHDHAPVGLGRAPGGSDDAHDLQAKDDAALSRGFMPAETAPEQPAADRYAEPPLSEPAEAPAFDEPAAAALPETSTVEPEPSLDSEAAPAETDSSQTLPALEIPSTEPGQVAANPLRRLSAAEPLPAESAAEVPAEAATEEPAAELPPAQEPDAEAPLEPANLRGDAETAPNDAFDQPELTTTDPRVSPVADARETAPAEEPPAEVAPDRSEWRGGAPAEPLPPSEPPADGKYTVQPNDNLWLVSEKAYGTGGYFKALYEFNRARLPRPNQLVVGSVLLVPPVTTLEQNFPSLCPKQRKSAVVKARTLPASTGGRRASDGVYVVAQGDTLFDIARYELGKASRWAEIYELNRDVLGEDFDYLKPGLELTMPSKGQPTDSFTRQDDSRLKR